MADYDDELFSSGNTGGFKDQSEKNLYEALRKNPNLDYDPEEDEMTEEQYFQMIERKKRIAERRAAGRDKRAREEALRKAKAEGKHRIPAYTKPVSKRTGEPVKKQASSAAGNPQKASGGSTSSALKQTGAKPVRKVNSKEAANRRGRRFFYICLAGYALILIIFGIIVVRNADKSLRRYEASRYENAIDGLVQDFTKMVQDGSVIDKVELPEHACVFESEDLYRTTYLNLLQKNDSFSYEKDKNSYDSEHPVYDIFGTDGNLVAKIRLSAFNEKTIFAMLRVGEWKIDQITPSFSVTTQSYRISVPDNYDVTINGIPVTEDFIKGTPVPVEVKLKEEILQYLTIPSIVTYEISGLAEEPSIAIVDNTGAPVEWTPDANGNISIDAKVGVCPEQIPEDRRSFALETAEMWLDFTTRDLPGANYGLGTIRKRLLKDSFYYKEAEHYSKDVDITFISDHRNDNPKYSNISVTDYTEYSDICYSCRIRFTKNMILTKTGGKATANVDTTNFFVYVDDTPDDGVINPHWCVVDMMATTNTPTN